MDSETTDLWSVVSQLELRKERAMTLESRVLQAFPQAGSEAVSLTIQVSTVAPVLLAPASSVSYFMPLLAFFLTWDWL